MIQIYSQKDFILDKLIIYLKKEVNIDYYKYKITDIDNNIVNMLIKKDSKIFKNNIEGQEYLKFNAEELIDKRMFDNTDEIIIIDLNFDENILDLEYLNNSLNYRYLSYSQDIKEKVDLFINYVINKNLKREN